MTTYEKEQIEQMHRYINGVSIENATKFAIRAGEEGIPLLDNGSGNDIGFVAHYEDESLLTTHTVNQLTDMERRTLAWIAHELRQDDQEDEDED